MAVKLTLAGKLPDADLDGLAAAAPLIEQNPHDIVTGMFRLKLRSTTYDQETGDITLKMGMVHVELARGADEDAVADIMRRAAERRTGLVAIDGFSDAGSITVGPWEGSDDTEGNLVFDSDEIPS